MIRTLCTVRLVVLILAGGDSLVSSGNGLNLLVVLAAMPFSFVPVLNWRTKGAQYFHNGVLLAADTVVTVAVLVVAEQAALMAAYGAVTVTLWGAAAGGRIALVMATPIIALLTPWSHLGSSVMATVVGLLPAFVVSTMAWAGNVLGAGVRRHQQTAIALSRERESLAALSERLRIARGLHDTVAGDLAGLSLMARAMRTRLESASVSPETVDLAREVEAAVVRAHGHTRGALDELRICTGDLAGDLPTLVERWAAHSQVVGKVDLGPGIGSVDAGLADDVCAVVSELLENVRKHADASVVDVVVRAEGGGVIVTVDDDGSGSVPSDKAGHYGLRGIRERADAHGGRATWERSPLGGIRARVRFGVDRSAEGVDVVRRPAPAMRRVA